MKSLIVVGARPNFIKVLPLLKELDNFVLVHTGQHYDFKMSKIFFSQLGIPDPDYNLEIGSSSHSTQTAKAMEEIEKVVLKEKPELMIVLGDVNSTLAGALVAAKSHIPLAHVEAGLRSFDLEMPEEINRVLTDHISDYLFVSDPSGLENLAKEGIPKDKVFYVGNVMIDTLINFQDKIKKINIHEELGLKEYGVLTFHRSENVDNKDILKKMINIFEEIAKDFPVIFPAHPRTIKRIKEFDINTKYLKIIKPLGYLENLSLIEKSKFVITDSGGIQEETTFLNVPCLTVRDNTERPVTVKEGTNIIVKRDKGKILKEIENILKGTGKKGTIPKYWDGKTSKRIIDILKCVE